MVGVACPPSMGREDGRHGWLGRRRRWRWAQRAGRGPGGWPACTQPRLSPGVLVQDSHRSSFCSNNLTEHTPQRGAACGSYVAQTALFRHITAREARDQTARQPAGHYGKWLNWANALEQPPARLRGGVAQGFAGLGLGPGCTEKRSLGRGPR